MRNFYKTVAKIFRITPKKARGVFIKTKADFQKGFINEEEFWKRFCKVVNKDYNKELIGLFKKDYQTVAKGRMYMRNFILRLKSKGYTIVAFSNTVEPHAKLSRKTNLFRDFDFIFLSNEIGHIKPEKSSYTYVLNKLKLKPQECVFIDDYSTYVAAAKKIGINAILFTHLKKLKGDLKRLGIKF